MLPVRALGNPIAFGACLAALFLLLCIQRAALPVRDPDVFWLAAVGRDFVLQGLVPTANHYSFTAPEYPWVTHEPGFAALYGAALGHLGPASVPLMSLALAATATLLAVLVARSRSRYPASAALVALLCVAASAPAAFEPRPAYATLSLPVALVALAFGPVFDRRRLLATVALLWLWAQLHGSFVLGLALIAASSLSEPPADRARRLIAAGSALLVCLANPYGARLYALVARYLTGADPSAHLVLSSIKEFAPLWRAQPPYRNPFDFAMLGCVALLALAALVQARTRARGLVVLGLVAAATWQIRHLTLAVLLGPLLLTEVLDQWLDGDPRAALGRFAPTWLAFASMAPGAIVGFGLWTRAAMARDRDDWIGTDLGGPAAAALIRAIPDGSRVWAPFQASGLVLWLAAPRGVRVFHDPRNDCYPADVARADWLLNSPLTDGSEAGLILDRARADAVIAPQSHARALDLSADPAWALSQRDGDWVLLRRKPPRPLDDK